MIVERDRQVETDQEDTVIVQNLQAEIVKETGVVQDHLDIVVVDVTDQKALEAANQGIKVDVTREVQLKVIEAVDIDDAILPLPLLLIQAIQNTREKRENIASIKRTRSTKSQR